MNKAKASIIKFLSTFFCLGYFPFATGTVGTLAGVLCYIFLYRQGVKAYFIFTVLFCISGISVCSQAEIIFGQKDSPKIIIDEIAGFLISMFLIPFKLKYIFLGFLLFRIFDIWKPCPIFSLQNLRGGLGIMVDDVMAGVFTNLALQLLNYLSI